VREHSALHAIDGTLLGEVSSGLLSPSLNQALAMGYVTPSHAALGTRIQAMVRGKPVPMQVSALPFIANRYFRG
jgi:aminomethyltransferase